MCHLSSILFMHDSIPDSIRQHVVERPDHAMDASIPRPKQGDIRHANLKRKVVAYTLDESYRQEFANHIVAAKELNLDRSNILNCLKNQVKMCGSHNERGLFWEYAV